MENKVYESDLVWNFDTVISSLMAVFNIVLMLLIFYFVYKIYRKISNFLDKK
jgi:Na+/alanine symporter